MFLATDRSEKMADRTYEEIDKHIMEDEKPSNFLNTLMDQSALNAYPFTMLSKLAEVEQSPQHHPEGNVWNHTMMVLDHAAGKRNESRDPRVFMWSALLHDLGKAPATKVRKGKITAYDHDKFGEELASQFLKEFHEGPDFVTKVAAMVRWHMQILYVVKDLPFANIKEMLHQVPLEEITLLSYCDRMGRGDMDDEKRKEEEENVRIFLEKCRR
jgi:putative nucleotidyltransferase with HDIG domain